MHPMPAIDAFRLLSLPGAGGHAMRSSRLEANARLRFTVAQALAQGRLGFHFQPVVRADAPHLPAFFEMLARIRLPNGQILPAGAFMPAVADGELGRAIDRLALAKALEALAATPALRLSVNVSPRSMGDEDWLGILGAAHRGGSGVCGRLILEVTEDDALRDAAQTLEFMHHVRRMGPAFALDDFGAGATGFRHFRDFRFDMVKMDGGFVTGVHANPDAQVLVRCLVTLAQHFEMLTVAERVETRADADWLRAAGIDCLQGYLIGRPAAVPVLPPTAGAEEHKAAG
jgi:EAL domain-containing protein (putative c-di-GMP-specific phosphodiesterase class I)